VVALLLVLAQAVAAVELVRPIGAVALVAFGSYKLLRPRSHPRWVGLRVGPRDLVVWSLLMSTAHGAGLMLLPVLLGFPPTPDIAYVPVLALESATLVRDSAAVLVHTLAMLAVVGVVAVAVYDKLGLRVLRRAWINFDLLWTVAVVTAGAVTLFT
jgi:hypothetical protein